MTTWSQFRTQIKRTVLKDTSTTSPKHSNDALLDAFVWACNTFCEHTALASSVTHTGFSGDQLSLPDDIYESLESAGIVVVRNGSDDPVYLKPIRYSDRSSGEGFYVWGNEIRLTDEAEADSEVEILYFAYYPAPAADNDVLTIPKWAEGALAFLTGAYVLIGSATAAAAIDQFDSEDDKGNPEHNPHRSQSTWMMKQYHMMINQHPRQDRENFFLGD